MLHHSMDQHSRRWPRSALPRPAVLLASFLALFLLFPGRAAAHQELLRAAPADGAALSAAPEALRLVFNEAVELAVSRLSLTGPEGPVALAPLVVGPDSATVLIGGIEGPLVAGSYTVNWQVVGADGHPVRGEYSFAIKPGARGLAAAEPSAATPAPAAPTTTEAAETVTPESSGSNALMWLITAVVLGVIGVVAFQLFARRPRPEDTGERV